MAPRTILCFGDSNTHGTRAMRSMSDKRRFEKAARWPTVMADHLGGAFYVIAEGHPGRTAVHDDPIEGAHKNSLRVLQAILESHRPIDMVIVMLGTNDLKARFNVSASDIALGLRRVVVEIRRSDCGAGGGAPDVLLAAPVPVIETGVFSDIFAGAGEKSRALPALLQGIAGDQGAGFVDLGQHATVDPVDGVHLNASAQSAIGAVMAKTVQKCFAD